MDRGMKNELCYITCMLVQSYVPHSSLPGECIEHHLFLYCLCSNLVLSIAITFSILRFFVSLSLSLPLNPSLSLCLSVCLYVCLFSTLILFLFFSYALYFAFTELASNAFLPMFRLASILHSSYCPSLVYCSISSNTFWLVLL
jgi:hypothetical protein